MSDDNNVSVKKQDIHDDNQHAPKLVPELRFPGFNDEWKKVKIKNIFNERKEKGFKNLELLSVTINDGVIKTDTLNSRNTSNPDKSKYKRVLPNDIAYNSMRMWQGACGVSSYEGIVSPAYTVLSPKNNINSQFFYYYFKTHFMLYQFTKYSQGLTSDTWNLKYPLISKIKINLPTYEEQTRIVNFINIIDKKIELLEKKSNLLKEYKHGFIQKLRTGKIKFKKNDGTYYSDWKEIKLSEILFEHKLKYTGNEEVYSVSVHKGVVNQIEHLWRSFATKDLSKYKLVKPGDLIYTKSPTAGFELGIIKQNKNNKNVVVSPLYGVFTPKSKYLGNYLDAYFESSVNTRNYLHPIVQKGAKNTMNITNKVFLSKSLYLPSVLEEQKKISDSINIINQKSEKIDINILIMKQFKKGLLQKMFV